MSELADYYGASDICNKLRLVKREYVIANGSFSFLTLAVRKLRIIPRRILKSTNSQQGAMYMEAGAKYVLHVSSLLKNNITTLRQALSNMMIFVN